MQGHLLQKQKKCCEKNVNEMLNHVHRFKDQSCKDKAFSHLIGLCFKTDTLAVKLTWMCKGKTYSNQDPRNG